MATHRSRSALPVTRLMAVLLLVATGCSAGSGAPPSGTTAPGVSDEAEAPGALTFTPEADAAATGTVTLEAGGTITATAANGTTFALMVPPEAVPGDTEITMTPLTDVGGMDADALHAVLLEPDGLEFYELARLTIMPAQPIPIENQLMIEAEHDGSDPGLALLDPSSEPIVLLLEHFSVAGIATASEAQRARLLEKSAANAEQRLNSRVRERIGAERYRQLTGGEEVLAVDREVLNEIAAEFQREVLDKRKAAAAESCRALRAYVLSVIRWERQLQLTGMTADEEAASLGRIVEADQYAQSRHAECEKEAIAACKDAEDPQILVDFWMWIDDPVNKALAVRLCNPPEYKINKTVTGSAGSGFVTYAIQYTGIKCGGPAGEWTIDSAGTWTGGGDTAEIGGPITVQIDENSLSGPLRGTVNFRDVDSDGTTTSQVTFTGTGRFDEQGQRLFLDVTGSTGIYGVLDTGVEKPGTLTFALEAGDFCP